MTKMADQHIPFMTSLDPVPSIIDVYTGRHSFPHNFSRADDFALLHYERWKMDDGQIFSCLQKASLALTKLHCVLKKFKILFFC